MEGTRNERSIIITLSYIIGFVTAFIMFMDNSSNNIDTDALVANTQNSIIVKNDLEEAESNDFFGDSFFIKSSDRVNVFYCEKSETIEKICIAKVYSGTNKSSHSVTVNGQELTLESDLLKEIKWSGSTLIVGDMSSKNSAEPWVLVAKNNPIDLQ